MNKTKPLYILLYVLLLSLLAYFAFFHPWNTGTVDEQRREINGWFRLCTNGFFSVLLNVKYSGPFCLLVLPSWIYLLRKGEKTGFAFFIFSLILIGSRGYINYRYAYTVFPLMLFACGLVFFSDPGAFKRRFYAALFVFVHTCFFVAADMAPKYVNRLKTGPASAKQDVFSYVQEHNELHKDVFLVNNLPEFYYRCHAKGYFYMANDNYYFSPQGKKALVLAPDSVNQLKAIGVSYLISDTILNRYNLQFDAFLKKHTTEVYMDARGRTLYKFKG